MMGSLSRFNDGRRYIKSVFEAKLKANKQVSEVCVEPLYTYLNNACKRVLKEHIFENFEMNWTKDVIPLMWNMLVVYKNNGLTLVREERRFKGNCSIDSKLNPTYQPLHFQELANTTFWDDLSKTFDGIVQMMLKKCDFIFVIQEGLFLFMSSGNSAVLSETTTPITRCSSDFTNILRVKKNQVQITTTKIIREKRKASEELVTAHNSKRMKKTVDDENKDVQPKIEKIEKCNGIKNTLESKTPPEGLIRWITPKPDVISKIVNLRENLKTKNRQSLGINPSPSDNTNITASKKQITCVGIFERTKSQEQIMKKTFSGYTIKDLINDHRDNVGGLRLPPDIRKNETFDLICYKMSKSAATKCGIKIEPQKRKPRKKKRKSIVIVRKVPFDPAYVLSTRLALYNKSSHCNWPINHILSKCCRDQSGVKEFRNHILSKEIGDKNISLVEMNNQFEKLDVLLLNLIRHYRMNRNFHTLVTTRLGYWIAKHELKKKSKVKRKQIRRQQSLHLNDYPMEDCDISTRTGDPSFYITQDPQTTPTPPNLTQTQSTQTSTRPKDISGLAGPNNMVSFYCSAIKPIYNVSFNPANATKTSGSGSGGDHRLAPSSQVGIPQSCLRSLLYELMYITRAKSLLGSKRNFKKFMKFVTNSIFLGGLFCELRLDMLMEIVNADECEYLDKIEDAATKTCAFAKILYWLFESFILVIIRVSFYATETGNGRNRIEFYIREAWKSISEKWKNGYLKKKKLELIIKNPKGKKDQTVHNGNVVNTTASLRLLPKKDKRCRTLLRIKKKLPNDINKKVIALLNHILSNIGTPYSIATTEQLQAVWKSFLNKWKGNGHLYYVRTDIQDAFPSVNVQEMKKILEPYHAKRSDSDTVRQLRLIQYTILAEKKKQPKYSILNQTNRSTWHSSVTGRPVILKFEKEVPYLDTEHLITEIYDSIESHTVNIGLGTYKFGNGLPQGCSFSLTLCQIYYALMDKMIFQGKIDENDFLVRKVDDYFFVSTSEERARNFLHDLKTGMKNWNGGCRMNKTKLDTNLNGLDCDDSGHNWIEFCGWKFCLESGHTARSFSNYAGQNPCSTLRFAMKKSTPEVFIFKRLCQVSPLRLCNILIDSSVNCKHRIILNTYDACLMMAFRFYAICRVMYADQSVIDPQIKKNGQVLSRFVSAIQAFANILSRNVARANSFLYSEDPNSYSYKCLETCKVCIQNSPMGCQEVRYIVYHAFIVVLKKYSSVFPVTVTHLKRMLNARINCKSKMSSVYGQCKYLKDILDNEMPLYFKAMKYSENLI